MSDRKFQAALHGRSFEDTPESEDFEVDEDKKEQLEQIAKQNYAQWPTIKT
jgi:hypothetical protein